MNRSSRFKVIALLTMVFLLSIGFLPLIQSVPPVSQETIIVDINGSGDFTSIQEAIINANAADIIMIKKGIYNEHSLEIDKKVEITGKDPSNTIIDCSGNIGLTLRSSYVDISNLQIINTGEYAISTLPGATGCTISNCIINTPKYGIGVNIRSSYNTISGCNIYGVARGKHGVKIHGSNNIVENCNIQTFGNGVIALLGSDSNNIINCNILNSEVAVDIRINSDNNLISDCNIYSNEKGVYIWQNSNNNIVYHNNFFKNDADAVDECNNTWYSGTQGNYWDDYRGVDADGDGIGDTPYIISQGNTDEYPLMTMTLPDEVTSPGGVTHVTSNSDNTPSFTWDSSIYIEGIKGYYAKIDNGPETFISNTTSWTSPQSISDGVHTFYVRAIGNDDVMGGYATISFSIDVTFIDADGDGWSDVEEEQYGTDLNNPDNYPLDTDNDRIPDSFDTDDDNDGYRDNMEISYGTDTKSLHSYPTDTDGDFVPDETSPDGKYVGDVDDDDDGLTDTIEINLGSDPKNGLDAKKIYIAGEPYHLVDVSQDNIYEILYNPDESSTTAVEKQDDNYLIDENGDGSWDYIYNPTDGAISSYGEQLTLQLIWLFAILGIIIFILFIFFYYTRIKPRRIKIFRRSKETITKPSELYIEGSDTVQMVSQTKNLLQSIQNDVTIYLDKLSQVEKQMVAASTKKEEEITPSPEEEVISLPEEKEEPPEEMIEPTVEDESIDIESKVDALLAQLDAEENT